MTNQTDHADLFRKMDNDIPVIEDGDEIKLKDLIDAYDPDNMTDWELMYISDLERRRDEGNTRLSRRQREIIRELWEKYA